MDNETHVYSGDTASYGVALVSENRTYSVVRVRAHLDSTCSIPVGSQITVLTRKLEAIGKGAKK